MRSILSGASRGISNDFLYSVSGHRKTVLTGRIKAGGDKYSWQWLELVVAVGAAPQARLE